MARSDASKKLGEIPIVVDKFHFKNHIGDWCIENCDPYKLPELKQVNTPVCEQLFKRINKHTNCKGMSEANYFLYWLTNLDHHNLDVMGLAGVVPDPRSEHRWKSIKIHPVEFQNLPSKQLLLNEVKELEDVMAKVSLEESLKESQFDCKMCGAGYSSAGFLKNTWSRSISTFLINTKCFSVQSVESLFPPSNHWKDI